MKSLTIIFVFLCAVSISICRAETLVADGGFDTPAVGFEIENFTKVGALVPEAGGLRAFSANGARIVYDKRNPLHFDAEIEFGFLGKGGYAGLIFNVTEQGEKFDDFKGYELSFASGFSSVRLIEYGAEVTQIINVPVNVKAGKVAVLQVITGAQGLHAYLNNEEILRLPDFQPNAAGRVGFISHNAESRFQSLRFSTNGVAESPILFKAREMPSISAKWKQLPNSANAQYFHDDENGFDGKTSQEFFTRKGSAGIINSAKFPIKADENFKGSFAIKTKMLAGKIFVRLVNIDASKVYAETEITGVQDVWNVKEFSLTAISDAKNARIAIVLEGFGNVAVDAVTLNRSN